ncbi:hypothetical protein AAHB54_00265, partial [Bacillus cereus]
VLRSFPSRFGCFNLREQTKLRVFAFIVKRFRVFVRRFIVLFVYCAGLYLRAADVLQGKKIVQWNIGAFLVMLINIFLLSSLSNFHFWYL